MTQTAWISLGSNLGDREGHLQQAVKALRKREELEVAAVSSLYRTAPWGDLDQPEFLNAAAELRTSLSPEALLGVLQEIELDLGRRRSSRRWGPRVMDLDLLLMGDEQRATSWLTLPHPRLHERAFVLVPLAELDETLLLPTGNTVGECLRELGSVGVQRFASPGWVVDKNT